MVEIKELLDLDKTIAKELFDGKTYPWEVLDGIKDFILKLGPTLDANEFDNPSEGVVALDIAGYRACTHVRLVAKDGVAHVVIVRSLDVIEQDDVLELHGVTG